MTKTKWLIKELVYALYNIPDLDKEIDYEYLNTNDRHNLVFELLKKLNALGSNLIIEESMLKYVEVIANKLCETKCLLVIDNVQYFPENFIRFIELIFSYSLIRNRKCLFTSVISFNISHMYSESIAMDLNLFFKHYSKSMPSIISWHLEGFIEQGEARVYFNQLLSSTANISEKHVSKFLAITINNPYYIKSTICWLEKNGILSCTDGQYEIKNYNKFYRGIDTLPGNIEEMISLRWNFFIKQKEKEEHYLLIFSIIHFYGKLDSAIIQQFNINEFFVYELVSYEFLKKNNSKNKEYKFCHDIIEDFFSKEYYPLSEIAVKKSILLESRVLKSSIHRKKYIVLQQIMAGKIESTLPIHTLCDIEDITEKWRSEYLELLMNFHAEHIEMFINIRHWIQIGTSLCSKIREIEGTEKALYYFDRIYEECSNKEAVFLVELSYGWFLISYCNVLYEANRVDDAIKYLKRYREGREWNIEDEQEGKILGYILNRLHVYYRFKVSHPLQNQEILNFLEQSNQISFVHNDSEIQYINLIDYGYCGYCLDEYKEIVLLNWKDACRLFETNDIPQKSINHIQTKINVALIEKDISTVINLCNHGLDYAINGKNSYYKGYFSERFYLYMASAYLMEKDNKRAELAILEAEEIDSIIRLRVRWIISLLNAIKYYNCNDYSNAMRQIEQTYIELSFTTKNTYKQEFLEQVSFNYEMIAAHCILHGGSLPIANITEFNQYQKKINDYSKQEAQEYIESKYAKGIITSIDNKINYPCI